MANVCPEGQNNIKLKKLKTAAIFLREAGGGSHLVWWVQEGMVAVLSYMDALRRCSTTENTFPETCPPLASFVPLAMTSALRLLPTHTL